MRHFSRGLRRALRPDHEPPLRPFAAAEPPSVDHEPPSADSSPVNAETPATPGSAGAAPTALRVQWQPDRAEREAEQSAAPGASGAGTPAARPSARPSAGVPLDDALSTRIAHQRGGGNQLAPAVRAPLERTLSADLSAVRVHTDRQAGALSRDLRARAFTTGSDIFFNQGMFNPASRQGQRLLTHEAAHVVQQQGQPLQAVQRDGDDDDEEEGEQTAAPSASGELVSLLKQFAELIKTKTTTVPKSKAKGKPKSKARGKPKSKPKTTTESGAAAESEATAESSTPAVPTATPSADDLLPLLTAQKAGLDKRALVTQLVTAVPDIPTLAALIETITDVGQLCTLLERVTDRAQLQAMLDEIPDGTALLELLDRIGAWAERVELLDKVGPNFSYRELADFYAAAQSRTAPERATALLLQLQKRDKHIKLAAVNALLAADSTASLGDLLELAQAFSATFDLASLAALLTAAQPAGSLEDLTDLVKAAVKQHNKTKPTEISAVVAAFAPTTTTLSTLTDVVKRMLKSPMTEIKPFVELVRSHHTTMTVSQLSELTEAAGQQSNLMAGLTTLIDAIKQLAPLADITAFVKTVRKSHSSAALPAINSLLDAYTVHAKTLPDLTALLKAVSNNGNLAQIEALVRQGVTTLGAANLEHLTPTVTRSPKTNTPANLKGLLAALQTQSLAYYQEVDKRIPRFARKAPPNIALKSYAVQGKRFTCDRFDFFMARHTYQYFDFSGAKPLNSMWAGSDVATELQATMSALSAPAAAHLAAPDYTTAYGANNEVGSNVTAVTHLMPIGAKVEFTFTDTEMKAIEPLR